MGIEAVAAALAIGGGTLKAIGAVKAGNAEYEAGMFNSRMAEQQAASERNSAAAEARDYRRSEGRKLAGDRAARGGTGVTGAGSPLLVDESTVREIALGSARIQHGGIVRGTRLDQEAQLYRMRGRSARTAGYIKAGTSILSSASSWAGSYG